MVKRFVQNIIFCVIIIWFSGYSVAQSQVNSNFWINYNQQYFKLNIVEDGIYKLSYSELLAAGVPVNTIDARGIQIFYNGEEQNIYIQGVNSAGIFDPSGFIEFYGQRNRGFFDTVFFDNTNNQVNNDYSLYNDTAAYFLTWNYSTNNRRMSFSNSNDYQNYINQAQKYCIKNIRTNYTTTYYDGSSQNLFTSGEGWFDNNVIGGSNNNVVSKTITLQNIVQNNHNVKIELAVAGVSASKPTSSIPHELTISFLDISQAVLQYSGYQFIRKTFNIPASQFSTSLKFSFSASQNTLNEEYDRNTLSYIDITYPYSWTFPNQNENSFILSPNIQTTKDYIAIKGFNTTSDVFLYDITNHQRISSEKFSDTLKMLSNFTDTERKFYIVNQSGYKKVPKISKISSNNKFTNYLSLYQNPNYIIITNKKLLYASQQYATYRQSCGYNVALIDIDQLYDQFAFGINKHPIAIRNYFATINSKNPNTELHLFIIGKGLDTKLFRKNIGNSNLCIVPSAGSPASDVLLTSGLGNTNHAPLAASGRLSVSTENEVLNYLQKTIDFETNKDTEWKKNAIHFGGGTTTAEQINFSNYLNNYKHIFEDTLFGGKVRTFLKMSSNPIQVANTDSVTKLINNGVSIMTFFGHGYANGFDMSIDFPENYNNKSKYPFIMANSCYSGDIFQATNQVFSEMWINAQNKGAIAYLATKQQSYAPTLNLYTQELYKNISYKKYNKTIGQQIKNTILELSITNPNNEILQNTYHDFTLNGDPAIKISVSDKPDLLIKNSDIFLIPNKITSELDSFNLKFIIKNIGKVVIDTFAVSIDRIFPNSQTSNYKIFVPKCYFSDTIIIKMPVERQFSSGLNTINIFVDSDNQIVEKDEQNNMSSISFMIQSSIVFPIYPYKYAIVPNKNITLIASISNVFAENQDYLFQIDTTDSFNSPQLLQTIKNSSGGICSWQLPFNLVEDRVYYWRIARKTNIIDSLFWQESTFVYEEGQEGWSQQHYYQFKENDFNLINYNQFTQKFSFANVPRTLHCRTVGTPVQSIYEEVGWNIDGSFGNGLGGHGNCNADPSINIAVIDPATLLAWGSDYYNYGHRNYPQCWSSSSPQFYFVFSSGNTTSRQAIFDMINSVPEGYFILAYTWANGYFQDWTENQYQFFENLGSTLIRQVANGHPYIFFAKKGTPSSAVEIMGSSSTDIIDLPPVVLNSDFSFGTINSVTIGPSMEWLSLHWLEKSLENPSTDKTTLNVYGITAQNKEVLLLSNITPNNYDIYNLSQQIDYHQYSNLKLKFSTQDTENKTPAQLKKWQLKFKNVPETAIDPKLGFVFCCDTVQQGENIKFAVATKNITPTLDMDSLLVRHWIQNQNNEVVISRYKKLKPHPGNDILIDSIEFSTIDLSGNNTVWVEYNPINPATQTYDQIEQFHFNNIAVKNFFVKKDITNPLLDVSFDGRYIMNGELVSARPEILIKLKDENKYLALNDTSLFKIYLTDLQNNTEQKIYFFQNSNDYSVEWFSAELPNNSCKILYKPIFSKNGDYRLRVQAKDISGNWSAKNDYVIDFKVVIESSITRLLNYPNPFSTSTRFVFELTGYKVPDKLQIEIFTVSGKLVKIITLEELGEINIGRNITTYAWDGTDMYGDRLANGIYFYRVHAKIDGKDIKQKESAVDKYFKQEIGKMYLIR